VSAVLGALAILVLYAVIRRAPRSWWAWGAGVATVFGALLLLIAPAVIDPLFNTYKPLAAGEVRDSILSMARANGVPANDVLEFDASRQTHRISANVSGIFGSAAIRLNDNLLKRTSLPEIRAVTGHEMGHYVLNHIYKALIIMGVVFVAVGLAVHHISSWLLARYGSRWGLRGLTDVASLPLLAAVFSTVMLFATPVTNNLTMSQEIEADIFGINVAREPDGFAEVALKLSEYRKVKPAAWEAFIFNTHPSAYDRVLMAMRWKAENQALLAPRPAQASSSE
jgi:STE24 endopeptidase